MPEVSRPVRTIEVNYVCDSCRAGMMQKVSEPNPETGDTLHNCMICGHEQVFQWTSYPRIDYVGDGDSR